ncbi:MAG: HesA/MoeB/ThiF family protein [Clostridia bacterium]
MDRYVRQVFMPEIGLAGQQRLQQASAFVVGAGGLGSALLFCLAGAGIGHLGIADFDTVSESNLNRQFLHTYQSLGKPKTDSAVARLQAFNPDLHYAPHNCRLGEDNAESLIGGYDIVLSAVDCFSTRLTLNRACLHLGKPLVNGAVDGMCGTLQIVEPGKTACLSCLYGDPPKNRSSLSFAPVVSVISSLMAQATLLLLLGRPNPLADTLLHFDGASLTFEKIPLRRNPNCSVCGEHV